MQATSMKECNSVTGLLELVRSGSVDKNEIPAEDRDFCGALAASNVADGQNENLQTSCGASSVAPNPNFQSSEGSPFRSGSVDPSTLPQSGN